MCYNKYNKYNFAFKYSITYKALEYTVCLSLIMQWDTARPTLYSFYEHENLVSVWLGDLPTVHSKYTVVLKLLPSIIC